MKFIIFLADALFSESRVHFLFGSIFQRVSRNLCTGGGFFCGEGIIYEA